MSIDQELAKWDGKSADDIRAIYERHCAQPDFADTIITLAEKSATEKGATWLLKAWLEAGNELAPAQITLIYGLLSNAEHWEARLHLLQCMPFMPKSEDESSKVHGFLRASLTDRKIFVRAWAYNGFYELSRQHSRYRDEAWQYFEMAMRDESASVKARIRNIMKNGF